MFPVINAFRCDGCGVCIGRCPAQIMGLINGKAAYLQMLCEECGICAEVCPIGAVRFELPEFFGAGQVHEAYQFKR
jgi:NAD-dependent dihydropyrimidine dehydrogenase PreA subunit